MSRNRCLEASLRLPSPALKLSGARAVEEALVDASAYVVDEQNSTTAYSLTSDGRKLQVSFFLAQPPRVSYFCVSCTNGAPAEFRSEPKLMATEGNLALIVLAHGCDRTKDEYFVYQASSVAGGEPPALQRIPHPEPGLFLHYGSYYFYGDEVGFLRYRTNCPDDNPNSCHPVDDFDAFKIATLRTHDRGESRCNLYTYDSQTKTWERKAAVLTDQQYEDHVARHYCYMVINIGGDAGTMGWVDLEHGIILCDVLGGKEDSPTSRLIRYISLPDEGPVDEEEVLRGHSRRFRSVAAVHGLIKYVEVQIHVRPGPRPRRLLHGTYFSAGWTVVRWSWTASSGWHRHCELHLPISPSLQTWQHCCLRCQRTLMMMRQPWRGSMLVIPQSAWVVTATLSTSWPRSMRLTRRHG